MVIYKTKVFDKWAAKEDLKDKELCKAIQEIKGGLYDADLDSGLFKKRVAKPGQGKRGGFRTLLATNRNDKWFFMFGFPKNERENINNKEEEALKALANVLLAYDQAKIDEAKKANELHEVTCDEKAKISNT